MGTTIMISTQQIESQSLTPPIQDGNQNFAFTYDLGDGNLNAMGIPLQHQQHQQQLQQGQTSTFEADALGHHGCQPDPEETGTGTVEEDRRTIKFKEKTAEIRHPGSSGCEWATDVYSGCGVHPDASNIHIQMTSRTIWVEEYIPSADSIKRRTLEPPPRSGFRGMQPDGMRITGSQKRTAKHLILSEFFRSGSATEKTWGK